MDIDMAGCVAQEGGVESMETYVLEGSVGNVARVALPVKIDWHSSGMVRGFSVLMFHSL